MVVIVLFARFGFHLVLFCFCSAEGQTLSLCTLGSALPLRYTLALSVLTILIPRDVFGDVKVGLEIRFRELAHAGVLPVMKFCFSLLKCGFAV